MKASDLRLEPARRHENNHCTVPYTKFNQRKRIKFIPWNWPLEDAFPESFQFLEDQRENLWIATQMHNEAVGIPPLEKSRHHAVWGSLWSRYHFAGQGILNLTSKNAKINHRELQTTKRNMWIIYHTRAAKEQWQNNFPNDRYNFRKDVHRTSGSWAEPRWWQQCSWQGEKTPLLFKSPWNFQILKI